jgi:plastocyanin
MPGVTIPPRWLLAGLCLAATSLPAPLNAVAESLRGRVVLEDRGKASAEVSAAIVYFVPDQRPAAPAPVRAEITTRNRRFAPRTLAVPVGSSVSFPNQDAIQHNVFSLSPGNRFDLGRYGKGQSRSQKLGTAGVVRLFCNVHRDMAATVLVLDTPYFARVGAQGEFVIEGAPAGPGTLHVWHPRAEPWQNSVVLPRSDSLDIRLSATLPAVPAHLDKFGRPYRDSADDTYR